MDRACQEAPVVIRIGRHGIEDVVGKDEVWMRLLRWFIERFEQ